MLSTLSRPLFNPILRRGYAATPVAAAKLTGEPDLDRPSCRTPRPQGSSRVHAPIAPHGSSLSPLLPQPPHEPLPDRQPPFLKIARFPPLFVSPLEHPHLHLFLH